MKSMTVGELKAHFSEVLQQVQQGEDIAVCYGRKKEKVAVLVPYEKYIQKPPVRLGVMEGKAQYEIREDFKMSDEELLDS